MLVAGLVLIVPRPLQAQSTAIVCYQYVPFRDETAECKIVVHGQLQELRGTPETGSAKMAVRAVIKAHPALGDSQVVEIARRRLSGDAKEHSGYLLFADLTKDGRPDFYRAVPATSALIDYVKELTKFDGEDRVAVLRYCADYLGHKDEAIAEDAFVEFREAPDQAIREAARHMSAKALRELALGQARPWRADLYAFLLGHCGGEEDARALRGLLDRIAKEKEAMCDLAGVVEGYTLLKRDDGWAYIRGLAADSDAPCSRRYAALRAARFFHSTRPGVIPEKDIVALMGTLLDQPDLADLPIEDLRRWRCWDMTDRILALYGRKSHGLPLTKRTILRYALQCPQAAAKEFVGARRKVEREAVEDVEESLRYEGGAAKP